MRTMFSRKLWLIPALAALVLGVLSAGQAQAGQPSKVADGIVVNDVLFCDGGPQERVFVRTENTTTVLVEAGAWTTLPGLQVNFGVPAGDVDHILVQFSAEALINNADFAYNIPGDRILIRILLDGVPMEPLLSDQIFNTDVGQSNAVQACKRVGEGAHQVNVQYLLQDFAGMVALTGQLDGKVLHVQQSD
jgi:hypothetical protein